MATPAEMQAAELLYTFQSSEDPRRVETRLQQLRLVPELIRYDAVDYYRQPGGKGLYVVLFHRPQVAELPPAKFLYPTWWMPSDDARYYFDFLRHLRRGGVPRLWQPSRERLYYPPPPRWIQQQA